MNSLAGTTLKLNSGALIPQVGLGVWQIPDGRPTVDAVSWALEAGYRHIDTAQAYGNEESVGKALRDSGVPREDIFLTTSSIRHVETRRRRLSAASSDSRSPISAT